MTTAIAVAQLACPASDDAARCASSVDAIVQAAGEGAELVVLPELAASGYRIERGHLVARAERGDGTGPVLTAWREAARRSRTAVIGGFAEILGDEVFNSAVVIDGTGAIHGVYRKLHLFGSEHDVFRPGDVGLPIFEIAGLRLGVAICYDLRFPETLRILALRDVDLVAVPTAWVPGFDRVERSDGGIGQVDGVVVQANLNQVYVACADQVGREADVEFLGRSLVVDPVGAVVAGPLAPTGEAVALAEVDRAIARAARERGPGISPRANRRVDVYDGLLGYRGEPGLPQLDENGRIMCDLPSSGVVGGQHRSTERRA